MVRLKEIIFWFHIISTLFLNRIFFLSWWFFFFCRPDLFLGAALPCSRGFRSPGSTWMKYPIGISTFHTDFVFKLFHVAPTTHPHTQKGLLSLVCRMKIKSQRSWWLCLGTENGCGTRLSLSVLLFKIGEGQCKFHVGVCMVWVCPESYISMATCVRSALVHLDVLSLRPQTNTMSASRRCAARYSPLARLVSGLRPSRWGPSPLRGSLLAASAARFGPSALKVRSFWMDYSAPSLQGHP